MTHIIRTTLTLALALTATACQAPTTRPTLTVAVPTTAPHYKLQALDDVSTLAGTGAVGFQDGAAATFNGPDGLVSDGRALFTTDSQNHAIRQIDTQTGLVATLAGNGTPGFANGAGAAARFNYPSGITRDPRNGDLYVADRGNHCIRKIDPQGVVTTFAGTPTVLGNADGPALQARFKSPVGVAIAPDGTLFVVDYGNARVRKVTPDGQVVHVAGSLNGATGNADGDGATARFYQPRQCALNSWGFLYFIDGYREGVVRCISASGTVFTAARGLYIAEGIAVGPDDRVYVGGNLDRRIHQVGYDGLLTTIAGTGVWGWADGPRLDAQFKMPRGLAFDAAGDLYVADLQSQRIRKIDL